MVTHVGRFEDLGQRGPGHTDGLQVKQGQQERLGDLPGHLRGKDAQRVQRQLGVGRVDDLASNPVDRVDKGYPLPLIGVVGGNNAPAPGRDGCAQPLLGHRLARAHLADERHRVAFLILSVGMQIEVGQRLQRGACDHSQRDAGGTAQPVLDHRDRCGERGGVSQLTVGVKRGGEPATGPGSPQQVLLTAHGTHPREVTEHRIIDERSCQLLGGLKVRRRDSDGDKSLDLDLTLIGGQLGVVVDEHLSGMLDRHEGRSLGHLTALDVVELVDGLADGPLIFLHRSVTGPGHSPDRHVDRHASVVDTAQELVGRPRHRAGHLAQRNVGLVDGLAGVGTDFEDATIPRLSRPGHVGDSLVILAGQQVGGRGLIDDQLPQRGTSNLIHEGDSLARGIITQPGRVA